MLQKPQPSLSLRGRIVTGHYQVSQLSTQAVCQMACERTERQANIQKHKEQHISITGLGKPVSQGTLSQGTGSQTHPSQERSGLLPAKDLFIPRNLTIPGLQRQNRPAKSLPCEISWTQILKGSRRGSSPGAKLSPQPLLKATFTAAPMESICRDFKGLPQHTIICCSHRTRTATTDLAISIT